MSKLLSLFRRLDRRLLLILAFSVFAWTPLLNPAYFFKAHDAPHSIFYFVEFDQALRDGYLWPRWAADFAFGYGYPLFVLYAPLALYAAEIFHLLGLTFVGSIKTMYALSSIGAGVTMYLLVRRLFGRDAGLLAAVTYMYAPFHLAEIYVRSAYAEFVALAALPLVLLAFTQLVAAPNPRRLALAGLPLGLLALVHHTSFFTFVPFLAVYILYLLAATWRVKGMSSAVRSMLYSVGGGVLGLALSAIYLLPMLAEFRYVKVEQWTAYNYNYGNHFVYFSQFLSPDWGYGYSGPGLEDGMSFQLGAVALVLVLFGGWGALTRRYAHRGTALFFLASTVIFVWLMSPAAQFLWQALSIASLVQFPWRLLGLTAVTMSIVGGSLLAGWRLGDSGTQGIGNLGDQEVGELGEKDRIPDPPIPHSLNPASLLILLVVILGSYAYTLPQYTPVEPWREQPLAVIEWDRFYPPERVAMVTYTDEQPTTSPMEAQYLASQPLDVAAILSGDGEVETLRHGGSSDEVLVRADGAVTVQFYTYDFPGWQVTIDGRPVAHRHEPPYGLITVDVPSGEHHVSLRMGSTLPRRVGGMISLLSVVFIGVVLVGERIWRRLFPLL